MNNPRARDASILSVATLTGVLLAVLWFQPVRGHTFMGDDLNMMRQVQTGQYGVSFVSDLIVSGSDKFRPITYALLGMLVRGCGTNFDCYINANLALFGLNILIMAGAAYWISRRWWPSALFSVVIFVLSRFSYYSVLQAIGWIENLAMTFVLLAVWFALILLAEGKARWMWLSIAAFALAVYTHERLIALTLPMLALLFYVVIKQRSHPTLLWRSTLAGVLVVLLVPFSYVMIKERVLSEPFLVGTGGTNISDTFRVTQFARFVGKGALNLIGLNAGPEWLSGKYYADLGTPAILLAVFVSLALLALVAAYLLQRARTRHKQTQDHPPGILPDGAAIALLLLYIFSLLAAGSVTIRQEYRWLYAPFSVLILLVCFLLGRLQSKMTQIMLAVLLLVAFMRVDTFYRPYMKNVFFMVGMRVTDSVKAQVIDHYDPWTLADSRIYLVYQGVEDIPRWFLLDRFFFQFYTGQPDIDVVYVKSVDEIPAPASTGKSALVFVLDENAAPAASDLSLKFQIMTAKTPDGFEPAYDFIQHFPEGQVIAPLGQGDLPNDRAVFTVNISDAFGPHAGMALMSGYQLRYPAVPCIPGSQINFQAGIPQYQKEKTSLYVNFETGDKPQRVFERVLEPMPGRYETTLTAFSLPISACPAETLGVTFGVESPDGPRNVALMTGVRVYRPK